MTKYSVLIILISFLFSSLNLKGQIVPEWATAYYMNDPYSFYYNDMEVDKQGNIYVSGYYGDSLNNSNAIILKYDSRGDLKWIQTYDSIDLNYKFAIDDSCNVYISGECTEQKSIVTVKFNSQGILQWVGTYFVMTYWNTIDDIITDKYNSVYVTGTSSDDNITTIKYDQNGNQVWIALDSTTNSRRAYIVLDNKGNSYITTSVHDSLITCNTIKYDNSGVKQWEQIYGSNYKSGFAFPVDIKYDNKGHIFILAITNNGNNGEGDYAVIKYDTSGIQIWHTIYSYSSYYDAPKAMEIDYFGNIFVTAHINQSSSPDDAFATYKFDSSGTLKWIKTYTEGFSNWDDPWAITVDSLGYIYVTGESPDSNHYANFITIKYDTYGNEIWIARYKHVSNCYNRAFSINLDNEGSIYVSGDIYCQNSRGLLTVKYSHNVGIAELLVDSNNNCIAFPNPFETSLTFHMDKNFSHVELFIYDIYGKIVYNKLEVYNNEIIIKRNNLLSGIYFYRIIQNNKEIAKGKIIAK